MNPLLGTSLPAALRAWGRQSLALAGRHQRVLTASTLVGLAGFGVAAFGIAPLAPDAATLPQRLLTEDLPLAPLTPQLEALADHGLRLHRSEVTRASDTADSLLRRLGVVDAQAAQWLRTDPGARRLLAGRPGKLVSAVLDDDGRLESLVARYPAEEAGPVPTQFTRLTLSREGGAWHSTQQTLPLEKGTRLASGSIRSSLFAATDEAGLPDAIAVQMAEMFAAEIDFHRELRKGDRFSVVYESLLADGEPVPWGSGAGRVLAAEFTNNGKTHQAIWFGEGKGGYFDAQGQSSQRAFLASPLAFSRVTSGFAMRFHPIQQTWRAHLGVDYGAPTGTPVRSVGEGVVEFAGQQNGYGNVVQVRHSGDRLTVYAHLSRIGVKKGQRIEQGQTLGAVGATGWATGPHLHFEFRVRGQHQDPLVMARAAETLTLDAAQKQRFSQWARQAEAQLQVAQALGGATGRVE